MNALKSPEANMGNLGEPGGTLAEPETWGTLGIPNLKKSTITVNGTTKP